MASLLSLHGSSTLFFPTTGVSLSIHCYRVVGKAYTIILRVVVESIQCYTILPGCTGKYRLILRVVGGAYTVLKIIKQKLP